MAVKRKTKISLLRAVIMIVAAGVAYFYLFHYYNIVQPGDLSKWNKNENGIWLSRNWFREPVSKMTDDELEGKLAEFKRRGIKYLYPHVCPMDNSGELPEVNDEQVRRFLRAAGDYGDFFEIMPWVGGSLNTVDLSNKEQMETWSKAVKELVEKYDLPGVNVNIEPLSHGDELILLWLKTLRDKLGEDRKISFCGMRSETEIPLGGEFALWTVEDYKKAAGYVDQITVMGYDTGRRASLKYVRWVKRQLKDVVDAVDEGGAGKCRLLWGVPTYEDNADYFDPKAENIRTAFCGLQGALKSIGTDSCFDGVCVYAGWTTDDSEWEIYDKCWLGAD